MNGEALFVRTVCGAESTEARVGLRQHEARVASLMFGWNGASLRVRDGISPTDSLPVDGDRWQVATIGILKYREEKKASFDPECVAFKEREVISFASGDGDA